MQNLDPGSVSTSPLNNGPEEISAFLEPAGSAVQGSGGVPAVLKVPAVPRFQAEPRFHVIQGDVLAVLKGLELASFDAILCDPPYGLDFMGQDWDHGVPGSLVWAEALRVLRPGGHLMAFGGTRTFHRLASAIEDAGFEIRDCISWIYGSGFPKSLDVSKALDREAGAERRIIGTRPGVGTNNTTTRGTFGTEITITAPATDAAVHWQGYGTALKPAWEPCIVAMRPCDGTYAQNALEQGVAGLNIDAGRIGPAANTGTQVPAGFTLPAGSEGSQGRWPANLILDEPAATALGEPARFFYCAKASPSERSAGTKGNGHPCLKPLNLTRYLAGLLLPPERSEPAGTAVQGSGGVPQASRPRRILVPYSGSGSEMIGALQAGWDSITGIEREPDYVAIAEQRLSHYQGLL